MNSSILTSAEKVMEIRKKAEQRQANKRKKEDKLAQKNASDEKTKSTKAKKTPSLSAKKPQRIKKTPTLSLKKLQSTKKRMRKQSITDDENGPVCANCGKEWETTLNRNNSIKCFICKMPAHLECAHTTAFDFTCKNCETDFSEDDVSNENSNASK